MVTRRQILASCLSAWTAQRLYGQTLMAGEHAHPMISVAQARRLIARLRPLHEKKRPNEPGDWLEKHSENGQTFDEYLKAHPRPVRDQYRALYLQPLGDFSQAQRQMLDATADCMERFFGLAVTINRALPLDDLPQRARRVHPQWQVPQVLSTYLLDSVLKPQCPKDAAAVLGLTASDLWPGPGWNFVFGQASLQDRVGVWSLYRNGTPDGDADERRLFLRRTLKVALHETGHMLGIPHCIAYECGMNGSNNRQVSDRQPLEFCPECQAKVWWTCAATPQTRTEKLLEFADNQGLADEAACWRRSLKELSDGTDATAK